MGEKYTAVEKERQGCYDVVSDFRKEWLSQSLDANHIVSFTYGVQKDNFMIYMSSGSHDDIQMYHGYLDFGGVVDLRKDRSSGKIRAYHYGTSGTFEDTPKKETASVMTSIENYLSERFGIGISTFEDK